MWQIEVLLNLGHSFPRPKKELMYLKFLHWTQETQAGASVHFRDDITPPSRYYKTLLLHSGPTVQAAAWWTTLRKLCCFYHLSWQDSSSSIWPEKNMAWLWKTVRMITTTVSIRLWEAAQIWGGPKSSAAERYTAAEPEHSQRITTSGSVDQIECW